MQYDPLFQPQTLAQTYQLGSLEDAYATDPKKVLANFALLLVFAILAPPIVLGLSHTAIDSIPLTITSLISFLVVRGESCSVSTFVSRFGELRARIKQELANQRNWG